LATSNLTTAVNEHYLNKVMSLADVMDVAASEDIVDARGMKLVAKGTHLTRSQQNTLGLHKLSKPLESTLVADGAVDVAKIVASATRILDTSAPLRLIMGAIGGSGPSPQALLSNMRFGHPMRMMLTLIDRDSPTALDHSITVSVLAICMAKKLRMTSEDQMVAALAGLLHDIGELYIDPAYLRAGQRLLPHEWAHLVVHPRIGQMLISDLESYPASVGRAVAEHHERDDATGYPRQLRGKDLSPAGQAVSVAEMLAGVLQKDHALERAELALKIVPGEHAQELLAGISGALRSQDKKNVEQPLEADTNDGIERLFARITAILEAGDELGAGAAGKTARTRQLLERSMERVRIIQRAFISTGLDFYMKQVHLLGDVDEAMLFEKAVATREIAWRLRDIARDLALNTAAYQEEKAMFASFISILDDSAANDAAAPVKAEQQLEQGSEPQVA
jgi:HD-GYP domain-containing protein (c-di-GMP phosphodiesterase class II)